MVLFVFDLRSYKYLHTGFCGGKNPVIQVRRHSADAEYINWYTGQATEAAEHVAVTFIATKANRL